MAFIEAVKEQIDLRMAIHGPSGSGKTFTALRVASGLGGAIGVIDTEGKSARKYADRFKFLVDELYHPNIAQMVTAMKESASAGVNVLIIDSLTHAWEELLADVERIARAKYRGNTWSAWSEGTPKQRSLIDAILNYPGHVIATMRSKTEWAVDDAGGGKSKPTRIGLAPQQGKGIEYEFDVLLEMSIDHIGNVLKDRTGRFQDHIIELPGEEFGKELAAWLSGGAERTPMPAAQATSVTPLVASPVALDPVAVGLVTNVEPDSSGTTSKGVQWKITRIELSTSSLPFYTQDDSLAALAVACMKDGTMVSIEYSESKKTGRLKIDALERFEPPQDCEVGPDEPSV